MSIPVIDLQPLTDGSVAGLQAVAGEVRQACRNDGFFYVSGHGVSVALQQRLEELSRTFFSLDVAEKMSVRMQLGGRAWRGYFPVGDELTSGRPDQKEGFYFGADLSPDHPLVQAQTPLHGQNLYPAIDGFRDTIRLWLKEMTRLGHRIMSVVAASFDLEEDWFFRRYTREPLILFRIFHYPPLAEESLGQWSVGEHTDYGLLTILRQDSTGGLQIRTADGWIDAPVIENTFVCNIGDMLERMTAGHYRSTPHRVRNLSGRSRLSFPFFFDPGWDCRVTPIDGVRTAAGCLPDRWDGESVHDWTGTYGDYILRKVGRVFPDFSADVKRES